MEPTPLSDELPRHGSVGGRRGFAADGAKVQLAVMPSPLVAG